MSAADGEALPADDAMSSGENAFEYSIESLGRRSKGRPTFELILGCLLLSAACFAAIAALRHEGYPPEWKSIAAKVLFVCNLATIPPAMLAPRGAAGQAGASAALLAVVWRLLTFLAALALWTATKWPAAEFAAKCLVGCYFPFLALESWLSIRHTPR